MVRQGIKNYFVNLKHIFTPLGTIALGAIVGLSVLIPGVISAVRELTDRAVEITGSTGVDFSAMWDCIMDAVCALDWSDPGAALGTVLDGDWLYTTFNDCIQSLLTAGEAFAEQLAVAVTDAIGKMAACAAVLVFCLMLGLIGGYFMTRYLVRHTIAKRAWWKFFLSAAIDSALTAGVAALVLWLQGVWKPGAWLVGMLSMVLLGLAALIEAYVVHGWKKTKFGAIVNIKNVGKLWLTDLIIIALTAVFVLFAYGLSNRIVCFFLALPLLEIAFIVMSLNAESYVKALAQSSADNDSTAE